MNGQFRTPRHIIRMMVEMMNPSSDEVICDPACGFRVIIMTVANSFRKSRVSDSLPKVETSRFNNLSIA